MRRLKLILAAAATMAVLMVLTAAPALAQVCAGSICAGSVSSGGAEFDLGGGDITLTGGTGGGSSTNSGDVSNAQGATLGGGGGGSVGSGGGGSIDVGGGGGSGGFSIG